jgi:hypothetical protein
MAKGSIISIRRVGSLYPKSVFCASGIWVRRARTQKDYKVFLYGGIGEAVLDGGTVHTDISNSKFRNFAVAGWLCCRLIGFLVCALNALNLIKMQ